MKNEKIVNIRIEEIYPHPNNPRKDLGDLAELAESIKKNGVMQNLTVIRGHAAAGGEWCEEGYTLIIGHRRHAAAKTAGLTELPCRVVDMDRKEQVSTMLEENMQRNDLTVYEQAQGFQMMLDLGETEETIAEKTGFSRSTIRHRLNLAKLDQKVLQKKEKDDNFQMSLTDLYALEQVEDVKTRNRILKEATSSRELIWKAQNAARKAREDKVMKQIVMILEKMGVKAAPKSAENEQFTGKWETVKSFCLGEEAPKTIKLPKESELVYYLKHYDYVRVIKRAAKREKSSEEKKHKECERRKKEIKAKIKAMNTRKHIFVESILSGKIEPLKETGEVQELIWRVLLDMNACLSKHQIAEFFLGQEYWKASDEERKAAVDKAEQSSMLHQMLILFDHAIDCNGELFNWQGYFDEKKGRQLKQAFGVIERYGWTFEDDEAQLIDGTHELYTKPEEGSLCS